MTRAALISQTMPRTERARKLISKKVSHQAVANSWWSPSSLSAWLTEEFYLREIQPKLRTIKVREIAEALQVSHPYAASIRARRCRPHPRHWEWLAQLVGVGAGSTVSR
jgi:hypothetical protein